jgi:3-dehydroquinate dehydratase-2
VSKPIFILNGPNLNLLGVREPQIYGTTTLADVEALCAKKAKELGHAIVFKQSNHEGHIVEMIHEAINGASGIIINPAAYTHTSVAILDALKNFKGPIIELHISNTHQREAFRHHSYVSGVATAVMMGFGVAGYGLAVEGMAQLLKAKKSA